MLKLISCAAPAAVAALLLATPASAAMSPAPQTGAAPLVRVDCAAGFHIGPVGTCILGTDDRGPPPVVERRGAADDGCETRSVQRTEPDGSSETHTRTNCN